MGEDRIEDVIRSQLIPSPPQDKYKKVTVELDMKKTVFMICRNKIEKKQSSTEELKPGSPGRRQYSKAVDLV